MTTLDILKKTRAAWPSIRNRDAEGKNALLRGMADSLMACAPAMSPRCAAAAACCSVCPPPRESSARSCCASGA